MRNAWILAGSVTFAACGTTPQARTAPQAGASASGAAVVANDASPLEFIENDYPRALAEARTRGLPLFVDTWATWCHTCLSMREYVFPDPAMRRLAKRFVWLSLDTERQENATVTDRLAVHVLPTLFVIDPASESPVLAWPGSLTAVELAELLEEAARAVEDAAHGPAIHLGGPEAIDDRVTRLQRDKRLGECVASAANEAPRMPPGTALADVLRAGLGCASDLAKDAPERSKLADLAALGERVASDAAQPILADDRSDLYDYVIAALRDLGRAEDAKRVARAWASFLEEQASRAPTAAARAVFDAHRLLAYMAVGEPQRAVPMLEQSARDFPADYNPPARLASAFFEMKRHDDALAAIRRALALAYGPRKLRLWSLEADILVAKGDAAGARRALTEALDFARTVPLTGGYPKMRDAIAKRLASM